MKYSLQPEFLQKIIKSNVLLYCVVLLLILKISMIGVLINFPNNVFFADITKIALENFVNQARQSAGINPLQENFELSQAARLKAEDMVKNQYFQHTSPTGITPWQWLIRAGYDYKYAGENLAIGFFDSKEVYQAWLDSPSHKANLLNPNYKEVGTAVLTGFGNNNAVIVVQLFGTERSNTVSPAATETQPKPAKEIVETEPGPAVAENIIRAVKSAGTDNLYFKFLNSILYNSEDFLQAIIFGLSLIIIGVLIALIFFSFDIPLEGALIFRSLILIVLLFVSLLFNKGVIISIIPHTIII